MFRTLRAKLVASYAVVIFLCLVLAGSAFVYMLRDYQRQIKLDQLADLTLPITWQVRLLERAGASPDQMASFLRDRANEQQVRILLLDPAGTVVDDSQGSLEGQRVQMVGGSQLRRPGQPDVGAITVVRGEGGLVLITAHAGAAPPSTDRFVNRVPYYSVVLAVAEQSLTASWLELAPSLSFAALVSIILSIAVAILLSRSIAGPVVAVTRASEEVARGNYNQHIPVRTNDEVGRLAEAFNHMARQVDISHRTLRDFLANVSHELRTPLTSIQGFSQAMVDGTASSPEDLKEAAGIINEESERMRRMVEDLLLLSKIESGQTPMSLEQLDLREVLRTCIKRSTPRAQQASVSLEMEAGGAAPMTADGGRLEQLFQNLLDNALKHTQDGGTITVRLENESPLHQGEAPAASGTEGRRYRVSIHNTGSYIAPEEQERVFERFYQVDRARTRNGDGSGLGLAIASEIAHAHRGSISVRSHPEHGTTFVVSLGG